MSFIDSVITCQFSNLTITETHSSENPEKTFTLFENNQVLARAMERDLISFSEDSSDYKRYLESWDREVKLMQSACRLQNACCTVLVSGCEVGTYKSYGFLFNAQTADVFHAASHDISSSVGNDGKMIVPLTEGTLENMNLKDLIKFIQNTPICERDSMNEVNAHFKDDDLIGLFINKFPQETSSSSLLKIEILVIQKYLETHHSLKLPLFNYDATKGELSSFDKSSSQIRSLFLSARSIAAIKCLQAYGEALGYKINSAGRML